MRFKAALVVPGIKKSQWQKKINEVLQEAIRDAAVVWLQAAINSHPIPAWSGASLGTFSELASQVGYTFAIRTTPLGTKKGLGPGAGRSASSAKFEGSVKKGVYFFEYTTDLPHLIYNEYYNANMSPDPGLFSRLRFPGPYNFQKAGRSATMSKLNSVRIPLPKLVAKKTIKVK